MARPIILCGGRDHPQFTLPQCAWLTQLHALYRIAEVIVGSADGADDNGQVWAYSQGIACTTFWANWSGEGRSAGPRRNTRMLAYLLWRAEQLHSEPLVVGFRGGKGTADMCTQARKQGVSVVTWAGYAASQEGQEAIAKGSADA